MSPDELIDRHIQGSASEAEREELRLRLAADPTLVRRLYRAAEQECGLYDLFARPEATANPSTSIVRRRRRNRDPGQRLLVAIVALAACLVIATLLLVAGHTRPNAQPAPPLDLAQHPTPPASPAAPLPPVSPPPGAPNGIAQEAAPAPLPELPPLPLAPVPEPELATAPAPPATAEPPPVSLPTPPTASQGEILRQPPILVRGELASVRYAALIPQPLPTDRRLAVMLTFHGNGGNEEDMIAPVQALLAAQGAADGYIVAGLKSQKATWSSVDEAPTLEFLAWLARNYPVEGRRIFAYGYSAGGWMSTFMGGRHPELLAGIVSFAGPSLSLSKPSAGTAPTAFYLVHGAADGSEPVEAAHKIRDQLRNLGLPFIYRELPGAGHGMLWPEPLQADLLAWLERTRQPSLALSAEDQRLLTRFASRVEGESLLAQPGGAAELSRIGGAPAAAIALRQLKAKEQQVRLAAISVSGRCWIPGTTGGRLAPLLQDPLAEIRQATIGVLAEAARLRNDEAIILLVRLALSESRDADDRLRATQALGSCLGLGAIEREDNVVCAGLIRLLDSESAELRAAAAAPLLAVVGNGFGYSSDLPAAKRRKPLERWREWHQSTFNAKK